MIVRAITNKSRLSDFTGISLTWSGFLFSHSSIFGKELICQTVKGNNIL